MSGVDLPTGWAEATLGDVVEVVRSTFDPKDHPDTTYNYVSLEWVESGRGKEPPEHPTLGKEIGSAKLSFAPNDVLYGKLRPYLKKVFVATRPGAAVTDLVPLRPRRGVDPGFIKHFLLSPAHDAYIAPLMKGIQMPRLGMDEIARLPLPLPPAAEQQRIVARLDALQARSRAAREALAEVPALLDQLRQSVLAAAFRGDLTAEWRAKNPDVEPASVLLERIRKERRRRWEEVNPRKNYVEPEPIDAAALPELPGGWAWALLPECGEMARGRSRCRPRNDPSLFIGGTIPFIQTGEVARSGGVISEATAFYNDVGLEQSRLFPAGTVCITIAANIAETGVLGIAACFPDSVVGVVVDGRLTSPTLLEAHLRTARADLELFAPATAQKNINLEVLNRVAVPILPEGERAVLEHRIREGLRCADALEAGWRESQGELSTLDQAILARAFRGELVDQDPNDEPAEVILARLRAAREVDGATPTTRRGRPRKTTPAK